MQLLILRHAHAEPAAAALGTGIEVDAALDGGLATDALLAWLASIDAETAMIVGHEPGLSRLIAAALCHRPGAGVRLKKAGACRIDFPGPAAAGAGELQWLLTPSQLERMGDGCGLPAPASRV